MGSGYFGGIFFGQYANAGTAPEDVIATQRLNLEASFSLALEIQASESTAMTLDGSDSTPIVLDGTVG